MKTNPNSPYNVAVLARGGMVMACTSIGFWRFVIGL